MLDTAVIITSVPYWISAQLNKVSINVYSTQIRL